MVITVDNGGGAEVLILKSCPKCKTGTIGVDRDQYGWYEYCIQCGYVRDLIDMAQLRQEPACGGKKKQILLNKGESEHA
jgi:hypothetical protein